MAGGAFPDAMVRAMFFDREGARCFKCGRFLLWHERGYGWSAHHKKARGMGGTRRVMTPADGLILCGSGTTGCHGWVEANRAVAMDLGYLIPKNATTSEFAADRVRVRRDDGTWWLLTTSGRAVEVEGVR